MKDRSRGIHGVVCGDAEIRRTERAPIFEKNGKEK
jgi:hypothetical protein